MAEAYEIEAFLQELRLKIDFRGILFRDDRKKNAQTLLDLDILPPERKKIILQLKSADYHQGPKPDTLNKGSDMWVFKKNVKGQEVYIKITLGLINNSAVCISFHT